ncbi:MAG: glutamate-cysteine ligase family protein [Gemmatimonadaceae bacterium]
MTAPGRRPAIAADVLARLADDVRRRLFTRALPAGTPPRLGVEVELLPALAATGRPLPIESDLGPSGITLLRAVAAGAGWRETRADGGAPGWQLPDGGTVSFEPGGQMELSSAAATSLTALRAQVRCALDAIAAGAARMGVLLHTDGVDPVNGLDAVPLQLRGERYVAMDAYFATTGTAGARMMRQTAALQVNVDLGDTPAETARRWRVLNAAAPLLTATFANSSRYAGADSGCRSYRAWCWRELDPARTGAPIPDRRDAGDDLAAAVLTYRDFALDAPWIWRRDRGGYRPFAHWLAEGAVGDGEWRAHLTTLFPEVRPRGFLEVRAIDALPERWRVAPLVLLVGLVEDPAALAEAERALPPPTDARLRRAARLGLGDPGLAAEAARLAEIALGGYRRLHQSGAALADDGEALNIAEEYVATRASTTEIHDEGERGSS